MTAVQKKERKMKLRVREIRLQYYFDVSSFFVNSYKFSRLKSEGPDLVNTLHSACCICLVFTTSFPVLVMA